MRRVSVCVVTRRRPKALARLLRGLAELAFDKCAEPSIQIVVVDNDAEGSGRSVVLHARAALRWPVDYAVEPRQGIAIARNTAVARTSADTEFIAFIDDDEVPAREWLDELLAAQAHYGADIVAGPVLPRFEASVAPWLEHGGFYCRKRYPTGSPIDRVATNNVLFRRSIFFDAEIRFNERMALTGGADTLFFLEATRAGFRAVWADAAHVEEWLPASRLKAQWLLLRAYRGGNSFSLGQLELEPAILTRLSRFAKGAARILVSVFRIPAALVGGRPALLRALMGVMLGAGTIAAVLGARYDEYRTTHGT
jgi:succinoglycan biosynthesis protein ExoM